MGTAKNGFDKRWSRYAFDLKYISVGSALNVRHMNECGLDSVFVTLVASMVTPEEMYGKEEELISLLVESGAKISNTCKTSVEIRERQTRVGMLQREEELRLPQETREVLVTTRRRILVEDRCGENDCRGCKLTRKEEF